MSISQNKKILECCVNQELTKAYSELARFLRIIGDNNRLKIICLLKDKSLYVDELAGDLGLAQNLISSHLKILTTFRLIDYSRVGKRSYYKINKESFNYYNSLLTNFLTNL